MNDERSTAARMMYIGMYEDCPTSWWWWCDQGVMSRSSGLGWSLLMQMGAPSGGSEALKLGNYLRYLEARVTNVPYLIVPPTPPLFANNKRFGFTYFTSFGRAETIIMISATLLGCHFFHFHRRK